MCIVREKWKYKHNNKNWHSIKTRMWNTADLFFMGFLANKQQNETILLWLCYTRWINSCIRRREKALEVEMFAKYDFWVEAYDLLDLVSLCLCKRQWVVMIFLLDWRFVASAAIDCMVYEWSKVLILDTQLRLQVLCGVKSSSKSRSLCSSITIPS